MPPQDTHDGGRLALRYAIACEPGQYGPRWDSDAAYAGPHLLAVAAGIENLSSPASPGNLTLEELRQLDVIADAENIAIRLGQRIYDLGEAFRNLSHSDPRWSGTGTMVTAMLWQEKCLAIAHIGNSRAYRIHDGTLTQLTRDHTIGQLLVDDGHISASDLGSDEKHSLITQWIDGKRSGSADIISGQSTLGDRYLLAARTINSILSGDGFQDVVQDRSKSPQEVADGIVGELPSDSHIGLTVVVADVVTSTAPSDQADIKFGGTGIR